jgi:hypothetical protein
LVLGGNSVGFIEVLRKSLIEVLQKYDAEQFVLVGNSPVGFPIQTVPDTFFHPHGVVFDITETGQGLRQIVTDSGFLPMPDASGTSGDWNDGA